MKVIIQPSMTIKTVFYPNGRIRCREFLLNDETHRDPADGPAAEYFHENGNISTRLFSTNDNRHRPPADGPAVESFNKDGKSSGRFFYFNNKLLSAEEVEAIINPKPAKLCVDSEIVIDGKRFLLVLQEDIINP